MTEKNETAEETKAAETEAAETKTNEAAAETKTAEEKSASESEDAKEKAADDKSEAAAEKLGKDFDKKADEGDDHSAYTETDEEKEAKVKAEEKAKADEKASEEDPGEVDESLLVRAEQAGLDREEAGKFSSKEDLERTVVLLEESQSKKTQTPEEKEAEDKAKTDAEAKVKDDEAPYECKLDPKDYDEGLIKAVNELGTTFKKRVVALEAELKASHSKNADAIHSDRVTKHTDWLDSRINRLSDEGLKKVYGEGDIDDFESESEQFKARAALDTKITKIAANLRGAKKTVPSRNKLFSMAIESLHKGKSTKVDAKTKAKAEARTKEALGGGSSRVSAETAEAQALQTNKDFDKKIDED